MMAARAEGSGRPFGLHTWQLAVVFALVVIAVGGPLILSSYWVGLLTQMVILATLAMSLDLLLGYTGLPSLGHEIGRAHV